MNYFQYLLKNSKGILLFIAAFIAFVLYCAVNDGDEYRLWNLGFASFIGLILLIVLIGDYRNYKRLK